jgi:hypothetical protein
MRIVELKEKELRRRPNWLAFWRRLRWWTARALEKLAEGG